MTKLEYTLNEPKVVTIDNRPIKFVPVEVVCEKRGRSGDWHGWSYVLLRTKTGKLLAGIVNWSAVDGEDDVLTCLLGNSEQEIIAQLDAEREPDRMLAEELSYSDSIESI